LKRFGHALKRFGVKPSVIRSASPLRKRCVGDSAFGRGPVVRLVPA
jgi:hypothetical protein